MAPETAEPLKQSPMFEAYVRIAPRKDDWPVLMTQLTTALKTDYDWSADVARLPIARHAFRIRRSAPGDRDVRTKACR